MIDTIAPVMTQGARNWIRDLAREFKQAGIDASFAFSMECYRPPGAMAARYWDGAPVDLPVPSTQLHFGTRVRSYLKQMYKECADELAEAGLPIVLQFGETQWWYFPNPSGMPFYDDDTKAAFKARYGRPLQHFLANTDDPNDDIAAADFLRDRIWEYCAEVIGYVRRFHPSAVFECLWPLDANQGKPAPDPAFRALNFHVNLPNEWKTSAYGVKYFRAEGFDYDIWQKNARLMRQTLEFPLKLGRPASECMYLAGIYGPPDPPMREAYGVWRNRGLYSFCLWAFDQFCLNSRPVPLEVYQAQKGRWQHGRTRGRKQTPAEVVLRMVVLKHANNWSFEETEHQVRANIVCREFARVGLARVPDAKVIGKIAKLLGPEVVEQILLSLWPPLTTKLNILCSGSNPTWPPQRREAHASNARSADCSARSIRTLQAKVEISGYHRNPSFPLIDCASPSRSGKS